MTQYEGPSKDWFQNQELSYFDSIASIPLAEKLRPQNLGEFVGFQLNTGSWRRLDQVLKGKSPLSNLIFWGPPGTGKTSLALLLAKGFPGDFFIKHASSLGAQELRDLGEQARKNKISFGRTTVIFIDEIHRLNKSQQDVLLPYSERGDFVLLGATTENPGYELNNALLSRCEILRFEKLNHNNLIKILQRSLEKETLSLTQFLKPQALEVLLVHANGDGRKLLSMVETLLALKEKTQWPLDISEMESLLDTAIFGFQKTGDDHYDGISAFIKSVRGSDPDAAIYYLTRLLESGESPLFIARRLIILASEDIGNADPRALGIAVSGMQAIEMVGLPEASINLAQVTTYLATAPKSNASYLALNRARDFFKKTGKLEIPKSLKSAQSSVSHKMGYGEGYQYSHQGRLGYIEQDFLPEEVKKVSFYEPKEIGYEKNIKQYMLYIKSQK